VIIKGIPVKLNLKIMALILHVFNMVFLAHACIGQSLVVGIFVLNALVVTALVVLELHALNFLISVTVIIVVDKRFGLINNVVVLLACFLKFGEQFVLLQVLGQNSIERGQLLSSHLLFDLSTDLEALTNHLSQLILHDKLSRLAHITHWEKFWHLSR